MKATTTISFQNQTQQVIIKNWKCHVTDFKYVAWFLLWCIMKIELFTDTNLTTQIPLLFKRLRVHFIPEFSTKTVLLSINIYITFTTIRCLSIAMYADCRLLITCVNELWMTSSCSEFLSLCYLFRHFEILFSFFKFSLYRYSFICITW